MKSKKEVNKICKDCECNNNGWCVMLETNRYEDKVEGCGIFDDPTNFVDRVIRGEQEEVDKAMKVYLLIEYTNCGDRIICKIIRGVYSSYENAKAHINHMDWKKNSNIGIVDYVVDE